jgi:hypothetical protein
MTGNNYIPQIDDYKKAITGNNKTAIGNTGIGNTGTGIIEAATGNTGATTGNTGTTIGNMGIGNNGIGIGNNKTALTNADGSLSNLGIASVGLGTISTLGNLWSAWEGNQLAKKQFSFNKNMATKNYKLAKDAYERRLRRSDNLTRAQNGESMQNIYGDQLQYNRERSEARKDY